MENKATGAAQGGQDAMGIFAAEDEAVPRTEHEPMAIWWCGFAVESTCPWTARLLKKMGSFEACVGAFHRGRNVSPYVEKAGEQFLFQMSASREPLVFAMARLELALMRVKQGSADEYLVEWDRNPELVFRALRSGGGLPPAEQDVRYGTCISRDIPELVRCERL